MSKDPVCHMHLNEMVTTVTSEYNGRIYYFCNETCKKHFDEDPLRYVGVSAEAFAAV